MLIIRNFRIKSFMIRKLTHNCIIHQECKMTNFYTKFVICNMKYSGHNIHLCS